MNRRRSNALLAIAAGLALVGCGDGNAPTSTAGGGAKATGGTSSMGGAIQTGGSPATGGAGSTGGNLGTGGVAKAGGISAGGGISATGGVGQTGGMTSTGGNTNVGGSPAAGGVTATGGVLATGGSATSGGAITAGGAPGTGGVATGGSPSGGTAATGGTSSTGGTATTGGSSATGGVATGGATATGGSSSTGGATVTGGTPPQTCGSIASTATRPQLTATQAATYTVAKYLAGSDNWSPSGVALPASPKYTVAADGSGTHTTVKAALAAASGSDRVNILVKPGTYREKISVSGSTPITLYGADADASKVVIVYGDSSASAGGTGQSATFSVSNNAFMAKNLTFKNDFDELATNCSTGCQAVAFMSTGDKVVFENVRFIGNQDTICFNTTGSTVKARVYVKGSYIEGDTDYIFGRATVVVDDSELFYTSAWKPTNKGRQIAPSTAASNTYGYLFSKCRFTTQASTTANLIYLGRSWDEGIASAADWNASSSPNGQAVIRESELGAHIRRIDPWDKAATSSRPYDSTQNRFFEYCNTGAGAGP